jgi:hypothetical protein
MERLKWAESAPPINLKKLHDRMDVQVEPHTPPCGHPLNRGDSIHDAGDPLSRGVAGGRGVFRATPTKPHFNFITCEPAARKAPAPYS